MYFYIQKGVALIFPACFHMCGALFFRSLKVTLGRVTPRQAIGSSAIVSLSDCQPSPDFINKTHS